MKNSTRKTGAQPSLSLSAETEELVAGILDEYLQAIEAGLPTDIEKIMAAHPQLADPLREYFEGLELLHGLQPLGLLSASNHHAVVRRPLSEEGATDSENLVARVRRLGDYEIIREIGRGGMGVVYEAEQVSLSRRVALKVLPFAALLDDRQIQRFENEARSAARLHHPNIVPVHGVGCDRGVHFYAMQFIDGSSLRDVIESVRNEIQDAPLTGDHHDLGDETRVLHQDATISPSVQAANSTSKAPPSHSAAEVPTIAKLGVSVAEALHAAHECGVIHRDIKPSNLLLDRHGKVWITDFGLARCQTNGTMTNAGDVMGTLQYMSPEQAQGQNALIDPRSDVYSLGVTLYELLTLKRPFDGESHASVVRQIEQGKHQPIREVSPDVPRDLANVVAKAMATSREDRYATAQELADDLRRYLDGQPIRAKPPNVVQRSVKWAGRHRTAVMGTVALMWLASVCLTVTAVQLARGKAKTDEKLETNRQTIEEFGLRTAEHLKGIAGTEIVRRELLTEVLESHHKLLDQAADNRALRADAALTVSKIGTIHWELGELNEALEKYQQAELTLRDLVKESESSDATNTSNKSLRHRAALARCENQIAMVQRDLGNFSAARGKIQKAIATQNALCESQPKDVEVILDLTKSWSNLGLVCVDGGQLAEAEQHFLSAHRRLTDLQAHQTKDRRISNALASVCGNLAMLHAKRSPTTAIQWSEKSLEQRRLAAEDGEVDLQTKRRFASEYADLANLYAKVDRVDDATKAFRRAIELQNRLVTSDGGFAGHRKDLALTLNNFGRLLSETNRELEALRTLQKALRLQQELCDDFPADINQLCRLGGIHNNLAMCSQERNPRKAEDHFRAGLVCLQKVHRLAPDVPAYREYFDRNLDNYACLLRRMGKPFHAASVTHRRSDLCVDDVEKLVKIVKSLTLAISDMPDVARRRIWERKASKILSVAVQCGWRPPSDEEREAFSAVLGEAANREFGWPGTGKGRAASLSDTDGGRS